MQRQRRGQVWQIPFVVCRDEVGREHETRRQRLGDTEQVFLRRGDRLGGHDWTRRLLALKANGLGVIAKRPPAGAVWNRPRRPDDDTGGAYWDRWQAMGPGGTLDGSDATALALRFVARSTLLLCSIVGTRSLAHVEQNLKTVEQGPLADEQVDRLHAAFQQHDQDWRGMV